jgi:hypothetical protein
VQPDEAATHKAIRAPRADIILGPDVLRNRHTAVTVNIATTRQRNGRNGIPVNTICLSKLLLAVDPLNVSAVYDNPMIQRMSRHRAFIAGPGMLREPPLTKKSTAKQRMTDD